MLTFECRSQFVGCDLRLGLVVLGVVLVMLLLGDSFFVTRTVFNWCGVGSLRFSDVYAPFLGGPKPRRSAAASDLEAPPPPPAAAADTSASEA